MRWRVSAGKGGEWHHDDRSLVEDNNSAQPGDTGGSAFIGRGLLYRDPTDFCDAVKVPCRAPGTRRGSLHSFGYCTPGWLLVAGSNSRCRDRSSLEVAPRQCSRPPNAGSRPGLRHGHLDRQVPRFEDQLGRQVGHEV